MESGPTSEETIPCIPFVGRETRRTKTYLDAYNSGFEYGRPIPIEISPDKGADWLTEVNVRMFVARGQVLSMEQTEDRRLGCNLTHLAKINCEISPSTFDLAEFQLQLLCRDLLESLDDNRHLPFQVRRNGLSIHRLDSQSRPSSKDCMHAIDDLRGWLSELDLVTQRKFRDTAQLLRSRLPSIDETYRRAGRPSPFALEPDDEEAIASLSF